MFIELTDDENTMPVLINTENVCYVTGLWKKEQDEHGETKKIFTGSNIVFKIEGLYLWVKETPKQVNEIIMKSTYIVGGFQNGK